MSRPIRIHAMPRRMRGMSLIEVMVSVLILAVGLLGIAAMQALALRGGQSSLESSQAVMLTNGIIEAMRANGAGPSAYIYDGTGSCGTVPNAGSSQAANDLNNWVTTLKTTIGGDAKDTTTCGKIEQVAGSTYRVTVQWDDSRAADNVGTNKRQVVTETSI